MSVFSDRRLGSELAGYRPEALIGRGGMGIVYRAHDLALDRPVALKVLSPELAADVGFRERFLRESRLAASIDHPNIVPVYDAGEVAGELFIAMRFVEGADLKRLLAGGPLEPAHAVGVVEQVAAGLDAAHARGLVHRDVKPSNVLVADGGHVYLADFGLTRRLGEAGASLGVGQSLGTVDYVAPEQIRGGEVDGRADLYSLGCLLCECVSGEPPFVRPSEAAVLFAHLEEEPRAPAGLEQVLGKALAKDPEERFQSGRELVEAARSALGLEPGRARWPLAAAAAGLLLIGAALLAFFLTGSETSAATTGRAVRIDPGADRVAKTIAVGNDPSAIAAGSGSLWISNFDDGSVSKVDPATNRVQTLTVNGTPISIAVSEGVVFVVNGPPANTLTLIKAAAGNAYDIVPLERGPSLGSGILAADAGSVWLADKQTRKILKIDPAGASPRIVARTALPYTPSAGAEVNGLAVGEGAVWVIGNTDDRRLWRLDPATGRIEAAIRLPIAPRRVAAGLGGVWITGEIEDVVLRLNPDTGHIAARIPAGRGASGVAVGSGSVWVANSFDGTVSRIDPVTNRVVRTMKVGPDPADLVASSAGVWVTTRAR